MNRSQKQNTTQNKNKQYNFSVNIGIVVTFVGEVVNSGDPSLNWKCLFFVWVTGTLGDVFIL